MAKPDQSSQDRETEEFLTILSQQEKVRANKIPGVRTVLVVLSAKAMAYDMESLRQKIVLVYPDAVVFFKTTSGKAVGVSAPKRVDLLIDLTAPRSRQGLFYSRKLRSMARAAVGRNAGFFRKGSYDKVFDEKAIASRLPQDVLQRERFVQREVLALAGIPLAQMGDTPPDRGKTIALELPPMKKL